MTVWDQVFYTTTTTATTRTMAEGLYGYLNTFTINSQVRILQSCSRHLSSRTTVLPLFANRVRVSYLFLRDSVICATKNARYE